VRTLGLLTPRWNFEKIEFYFLPDNGGVIKPRKIIWAWCKQGGERNGVRVLVGKT